MYEVIRILPNGVELVEEDNIFTYEQAEQLLNYLVSNKGGNYYISRYFED